MHTQHSTVQVRQVTAEDRDDWEALYRGYRDFYRMPHEPSVYETVWGWLLDPAHEERGLIAQLDGNVVGIAHFRTFPRPIVGSRGLYLDDLFTESAARGLGVATAVLEALADIAHTEGASLVRWITDSENTTAQRLYDRTAHRTRWVTYDLPPTAGT